MKKYAFEILIPSRNLTIFYFILFHTRYNFIFFSLLQNFTRQFNSLFSKYRWRKDTSYKHPSAIIPDLRKSWKDFAKNDSACYLSEEKKREGRRMRTIISVDLCQRQSISRFHMKSRLNHVSTR